MHTHIFFFLSPSKSSTVMWKRAPKRKALNKEILATRCCNFLGERWLRPELGRRIGEMKESDRKMDIELTPPGKQLDVTTGKMELRSK